MMNIYRQLHGAKTNPLTRDVVLVVVRIVLAWIFITAVVGDHNGNIVGRAAV